MRKKAQRRESMRGALLSGQRDVRFEEGSVRTEITEKLIGEWNARLSLVDL